MHNFKIGSRKQMIRLKQNNEIENKDQIEKKSTKGITQLLEKTNNKRQNSGIDQEKKRDDKKGQNFKISLIKGRERASQNWGKKEKSFER